MVTGNGLERTQFVRKTHEGLSMARRNGQCMDKNVTCCLGVRPWLGWPLAVQPDHQQTRVLATGSRTYVTPSVNLPESAEGA